MLDTKKNTTYLHSGTYITRKGIAYHYIPKYDHATVEDSKLQKQWVLQQKLEGETLNRNLSRKFASNVDATVSANLNRKETANKNKGHILKVALVKNSHYKRPHLSTHPIRCQSGIQPLAI